MRVRIKFGANLTSLVRERVLEYDLSEISSLDYLIHRLDEQFPGVQSALCPDQKIVDHINIYVNGDNVRDLEGLETLLHEGDSIHIIPAAAAG